ncbi:MAG: ABC transporter permease, partial [Aquificota bacterium]
NRIMSVSVKGMKREDIKRVYGVEQGEGIVIGEGLANLLGVKEKEELMLISTTGRKTPFGFLPKVRSYRLEATFRKGVFEQDYATVLMSVEQAKVFFGEGYQISGYELYLSDPYRAQEVKKKLEEALGYKAVVRSWIDLNQALFNALQLEKVGIFFVLLLMVLIASFNITSLLFMKTKEKMRDIAILRTFGLKRRGILTLFLLEGLIIGTAGVLLGIFMTLGGAYLINRYELIRVPADVYLMDHIPVHIQLGDFAITVLGALVLTLLASFIPAYRASREGIVRILRNE